ncbi:MAG: hypothetical protein J6I49_01810 [Bacteroidales bacterium]|nr:hypothetical protein [Bacteroidales bacterium]
MKSATSLLTAVATLCLCTAVASAQNTVDSQGLRQGHWIRTDKDGTKLFEADYVDGLETGTSTYYYPSGLVRIRNTYSIPGVRCAHEAFDEQGRLLATGEYLQRNRDGLWKFYAADGHLVKEAYYSMGIKEGQHTVFDNQGDTAEITHWHNNQRQGRWWRRLGTKGYITGNYIDGNMEGQLLEYDDQGRVAREGNYLRGLKHGSYRIFEQGTLSVDERWNHGLMSERKIRLLCPEERFVSIFDIACLAPMGKNRVAVYLKDGSKLVAQEGADAVYARIGNSHFSLANRKGRIMVAADCIQGLGKDNEGRDILLLDPRPDFTIFPDEDGIKMASLRQHPIPADED